MIKFGSFLDGEEIKAEEVKVERPRKGKKKAESEALVEEVEAPPAPARWIIREDLAPGDFESPGFVRNPLVPDEDEDTRPRNWKCGRCRKPFVSEPLVWKGVTVFRPKMCADCAAYHARIHAAINVLTHPQRKGKNVRRENFCGFSLNVVGVHARDVARTPTMTPTTTPTTKATGPSGHAKHGPSSLKHKEICPHWRSEQSTNPVAEEGTMLHERLVTGDHSGLNESQISAVRSVESVFSKIVTRTGPDPVIFTERRVNVANQTWGTADMIVISGHKAAIPDAKFGYHEVDDAEINLQGWCYAVGVFHEFPAVQEIEVWFVQPRCDYITSHKFTRSADFDRMLARISTVIARAEDESSPFNPVPSNCVYCGAKAKCEALHAMALTVAKRADDQFAIPDELKPELITDPVRMAQAMVLAEVLEKWASGVKDYAKQMALNGEEIPGYELAERNAPRKVTNAAMAYHALKDVLSAEQFMGAVSTVQITELEKLFAANAPRGKKAQAKQEMENRLIGADALEQEGVITYLKKKKQNKQESLAS